VLHGVGKQVSKQLSKQVRKYDDGHSNARNVLSL